MYIPESWKHLPAALVPNTVLWRHAEIINGGVIVKDVDFALTDHGTYCARILFNAQTVFSPHPEPVVYQPESQSGGLVVFLPSLPPPDWTYLLVNSPSRQLTAVKAYYPNHTVPMDEFKDFIWNYHLETRNFSDGVSIEDQLSVAINQKIELVPSAIRLAIVQLMLPISDTKCERYTVCHHFN
jgi:hypothetical protein